MSYVLSLSEADQLAILQEESLYASANNAPPSSSTPSSSSPATSLSLAPPLAKPEGPKDGRKDENPEVPKEGKKEEDGGEESEEEEEEEGEKKLTEEEKEAARRQRRLERVRGYDDIRSTQTPTHTHTHTHTHRERERERERVRVCERDGDDGLIDRPRRHRLRRESIHSFQDYARLECRPEAEAEAGEGRREESAKECKGLESRSLSLALSFVFLIISVPNTQTTSLSLSLSKFPFRSFVFHNHPPLPGSLSQSFSLDLGAPRPPELHSQSPPRSRRRQLPPPRRRPECRHQANPFRLSCWLPSEFKNIILWCKQVLAEIEDRERERERERREREREEKLGRSGLSSSLLTRKTPQPKETQSRQS